MNAAVMVQAMCGVTSRAGHNRQCHAQLPNPAAGYNGWARVGVDPVVSGRQSSCSGWYGRAGLRGRGATRAGR